MTVYGYVSGQALETEVRRLVEEWRLVAPLEYENWNRNCRFQKDFLRDARAFTAGRLMQFQCTLPAHVHLKIGRFLGDHNWTQEPKYLEIVLSVLQNARMPVKKA